MTGGPHIRTPALDRWRDELRAKHRTVELRDTLAAVASREAEALEWMYVGCPQIAEHCLAEARRILRDALQERAA